MSIYQYERNSDLEALAEVLVSADNPSVRRQAAQALGNLEAPDHGSQGPYQQMLSALRTAAVEDPDETVRTMAVTALEEQGIDELRRLVRDLTDQPLETIGEREYVSLIRADRAELRMVGLAALGIEGTPKAANAVVHATDDSNPRVRERAVTAIGEIGLSRAKPQLVAALDDPSPTVRTAAATAIGELNLTDATSALADATQDSTESVRLAALDALASLGSPAAIDPLATALRSSSPAVNRIAVYGLLELVTNAPSDKTEQLRDRVETLATGAPRSTVLDTLLDLLEVIDGTLQRRNAVWLLGRLIEGRPTEEIIETLVEHVGHEDDQTATLATNALVRCEGIVVERIVRTRLADADPDGREAGQLAYVLGRVGSDRSTDTIETTLEATDSDPVRQHLLAALRRIESQRGTRS